MKRLWRAFNRLRGAILGHGRESELAEELESHIQMQTDDNVRAGMSPREARRAAMQKFGGIESVKESYREHLGLPLVESFFADLQYALRVFRKSPGFTVTAIIALALGIGATTAVFSIVNAALLKPMHLFDPDRLLVLGTAYASDENPNIIMSPAEFAHWRRQTSVLENVAAVSLDELVNYDRGDVVEQWTSFRVSADFFRCIGMGVLQGRTFSLEEDLPNGPRVAVISEALWRERFAGDPQILGKPVLLNDEPYTVIGITDETAVRLDFGADSFPQVMIPLQLDPNSRDQGSYFIGLARLKSGVSKEQARERLKASSAEFRAQFPNSLGPNDFFKATPAREVFVSDYRVLFAVLSGAVALVLLIACANVANLLLVRASVRGREIAIRVSIGAGRRRVIRQLMTESLLLSLAGGALGCYLGFRGIRALLAVNTLDIPLLGNSGGGVHMDWNVMLFTLAVSIATAVVFGLLPALQASRADLNTVLKSGARTGSVLKQNKARAVLVVSEVSLAVILLVGSALLIRSFVWLYRADRGFDTKNVLTVQTLFSAHKYRNPAVMGEAVHAGLNQLRSLSGVESVGATGCMPLQCSLYLNFEVAGWSPPAKLTDRLAGWATVSLGFFETLKIPIKRGRAFSFRDTAQAPPVAIINEAMRKTYWVDRDPLLDQIVIGKGLGRDRNDPPRQIVGVVADVRADLASKNPRPIMYVPAAQVPADPDAWLNTRVTWVIRTQTQPNGFVPAVRAELRRATGLPAGEVHSMRELVSLSITEQQLSMLLMTVFGCSALLLASIGIYGVMAYSVQQQSQEIGIRMALGAEAAHVRNMVVRQGVGLALVGVAIGLGAAWPLARSLEVLLFGVKAHDAIVFIAVPVILCAIAVLAVWVPASRASRVNPMDSLRCE